jgi:hypothetical protein
VYFAYCDRMRRLAAVGFVVLAVGIALFACVFHLFAADVVAASRASELGPDSWVGDFEAWQWDAITTLGLVGVVLAGLSVVAVRRGQRSAALAGAAGWMVVAIALTGLVRHASANSGATLAVWQVATAGLLVAVVARMREP